MVALGGKTQSQSQSLSLSLSLSLTLTFAFAHARVRERFGEILAIIHLSALSRVMDGFGFDLHLAAEGKKISSSFENRGLGGLMNSMKCTEVSLSRAVVE